jgi:hypothetical protein
VYAKYSWDARFINWWMQEISGIANPIEYPKQQSSAEYLSNSPIKTDVGITEQLTRHTVYLTLFAASFLFVVVMLIEKAILFSGEIYDYSINRKYTQANIVLESLFLLSEIEKLQSLDNVSIKKKLILKIFKLANVIQNNMPRHLLTEYPELNNWLKTKMTEIAYSLRELSKEVLLPSENTKNTLIEFLKDTLVCSAKGEWSSIRIYVHEPKIPLRGWPLAKEVGKFLIVVFSPIAIFFIVQTSPIKIIGDALEYFKLLMLLWIITNLLSLIEPKFDAKIMGLKNIISLIRKD